MLLLTDVSIIMHPILFHFTRFLLIFYFLFLLVVLSSYPFIGSQALLWSSEVWCDHSDQWHTGRKETASLQDWDHWWFGGAHSHPGKAEEAKTSRVAANNHNFIISLEHLV